LGIPYAPFRKTRFERRAIERAEPKKEGRACGGAERGVGMEKRRRRKRRIWREGGGREQSGILRKGRRERREAGRRTRRRRRHCCRLRASRSGGCSGVLLATAGRKRRRKKGMKRWEGRLRRRKTRRGGKVADVVVMRSSGRTMPVGVVASKLLSLRESKPRRCSRRRSNCCSSRANAPPASLLPYSLLLHSMSTLPCPAPLPQLFSSPRWMTPLPVV
jgi:hypothetical protein